MMSITIESEQTTMSSSSIISDVPLIIPIVNSINPYGVAKASRPVMKSASASASLSQSTQDAEVGSSVAVASSGSTLLSGLFYGSSFS